MKASEQVALPIEHKGLVTYEHKKLVTYLQELPPLYLISLRQYLTNHQNEQWEICQAFWKWVGLKIDYLQRESLGYILPDPFESPLSQLHPATKVYLSIATNTLFAELHLMIAGWDLIKIAAVENEKEFLFTNPRELFAEYCKQRAIFSTRNFLSDNINQGESLGRVRQDYRKIIAFYQRRLEPEEELHILQGYLNDSDWFRLTVCAVWKYLPSKEFKQGKLKQAWVNYLQSLKAESAMICKKDFFKKYNSRILFLRWNQGNAVYAEDCRSVKWANP